MRNFALFSLVLSTALATSFHADSRVLKARQTNAGSGSKNPANVLKTTVCEVVKKPDSFDGMMIELRGKVFAGLETNILFDTTCKLKDGLPARILFTTADTPEQGRKHVLTERDRDYRRFWKLVQAYREPEGKRRAMVPDKYTVTATLVGRYDIVKPSVPGTGFHGQLLLKSVHDVVAGPPEVVF